MHQQTFIKHTLTHIHAPHCKHTHTFTHTDIMSQRVNRQGACAGSAVSAFSGMSKYPCLIKASDMLRKASRITSVSISPHSSSPCHATHPVSLNFTPCPPTPSCAPKHATSNLLKYADGISLTHIAYKGLLCCVPQLHTQGVALEACGAVYIIPHYII